MKSSWSGILTSNSVHVFGENSDKTFFFVFFTFHMNHPNIIDVCFMSFFYEQIKTQTSPPKLLIHQLNNTIYLRNSFLPKNDWQIIQQNLWMLWLSTVTTDILKDPKDELFKEITRRFISTIDLNSEWWTNLSNPFSSCLTLRQLTTNWI